MEFKDWLVVAGAILACALAAGMWLLLRTARRERQLARARHEFHRHREQLEAKFVKIAGASGKPHGLRWSDCDFDNDVTYARDRKNGQLSALVAVTIRFEAIEGGGMEEVEAVGNLRAATALFRFDQNHWQTDGRAIFNLNPVEAVRYYQDNLELVAQEERAAK